MAYLIYKLIHFLGIFAIYASYGGLIFRAALGSDDVKMRKFGAIFGGIGLVLVLFGGFGMMARMDYSYTAIWALIKMGVWLIFGAMVVLINRKPEMSKVWFFSTLLLGLIASIAGIFKPFA